MGKEYGFSFWSRAAHAMLAAAAVAASPVIAQPSRELAIHQADSDRQELQRLNDLWFEAYRAKDADKLALILADDFAGDYGSGPARTKRDMVEGLRDPKRPALDIYAHDVAIHLFGDVAMVTARSVMRTTQDGAAVEITNRYADIYARRDGKWRAIAAHVVRVSPPSP